MVPPDNEKNTENQNRSEDKSQSGIKISIRLKISVMIISFTALIIGSIGFLLLNEFNQRLENELIEDGKDRVIYLAFGYGRAFVSKDDIYISDNIQFLQKLGHFVYGSVLTTQDNQIKSPALINGYGTWIPQKHRENLDKLFHQKVLEAWDKYPQQAEELEIQKIRTELVRIKDKYTGSNLYVFHYPVYHPFQIGKKDRLATAQIVFSDAKIQEAFRENLKLILISALVFWIIGIIGSLLMSGLIVKPINVLYTGAGIVGGGNLDHKIPDLGKDELGALARQFNQMTDGLKKAQEAREEQLITDEQIRQAQEIQEGMNPGKFFKKSTYQIKGFTRAAKGVGGDYYDIIRLPDGKMAVLISDVSGKSISASLVMVLIKTVVTTFLTLHKYLRPDIVLSTINSVMASQAHIDKFATILFFIYDPETREVEFSNGGHGPLFIYRSADTLITLAKIEGLPMGIDENNRYSISKVKLEPGDMIILYTDGITEAWDPMKNEFGLKNMRGKILAYSEYNAAEIVEKLVEDLDNFTQGAQQHDDMTLVVFKSV